MPGGIGRPKTLVWIAGVLALGVAVQMVRSVSPTREAAVSLVHLFPQADEGWTAVDLPLAATELAAKEVERALAFESYVFRRFECAGTGAFDIYMAYWPAGKVPPSMVAAHSPDVCWVSNGWTVVEARSNEAFRRLIRQRGEWRRMRAPDGCTREVWFCHVGGRRYFGLAESGGTRSAQFGRRLKELWAEVWSGAGEQYFVRISSPQPFDVLEKEPFFREVLQRIDDAILRPAAERERRFWEAEMERS